MVATIVGAFGISAAGSTGAAMDPDALTPPPVALAQAIDKATLTREGGPLYARNCGACHGAQGQGDMGPKLINSDVVRDKGGIIGQIFQGNEDHGMPGFYNTLNDRQIAAIATYVRSTWGNDFGVVLPAEVAATR